MYVHIYISNKTNEILAIVTGNTMLRTLELKTKEIFSGIAQSKIFEMDKLLEDKIKNLKYKKLLTLNTFFKSRSIVHFEKNYMKIT